MVIVMNMATGVVGDPFYERYDDEVLNAGWANVPRVELQLVHSAEPAAKASGANIDVDAFMKRLYACQE